MARVLIGKVVGRRSVSVIQLRVLQENLVVVRTDFQKLENAWASNCCDELHRGLLQRQHEVRSLVERFADAFLVHKVDLCEYLAGVPLPKD